MARVHFGQVILSSYTTLSDKEHVTETTPSQVQVPGHQKMSISRKWGFPKCNAHEFKDVVAEKWLISDSYRVKYILNCDPLDKWQALYS